MRRAVAGEWLRPEDDHYQLFESLYAKRTVAGDRDGAKTGAQLQRELDAMK
jgi:hypothetical protein